MPRIENDRLNLAHIWDAVWPHQRLNGFGYVSARHQEFSILFNHGKTQPTSSAIDDGFPAAADELQGVISCFCLYFRSRGNDLCGQTVKRGNVVHAQVVVPAYLDDLPIASSNRNRGCESQGSEGKRENRPTLHREGHACAMVSKTASISRSVGFQVSKAFRAVPIFAERLRRQASQSLLVHSSDN